MTQETQPRPLGKLATAFGSLALAYAAISAACGGEGPEKGVIAETTPLTQPIVTREVPPTPTPISEPVPGSCVMFEEKYCDKAENLGGLKGAARPEDAIILGFRFSERVPIFAPIAGELNSGRTPKPDGTDTQLIIERGPSGEAIVAYGPFVLKVEPGQKVKPGQLIAEYQGRGGVGTYSIQVQFYPAQLGKRLFPYIK